MPKTRKVVSPEFRRAGELNFLKGRISGGATAASQGAETSEFAPTARVHLKQAALHLRLALAELNKEK